MRWFAALWVSFLRGVPLLVQLLLCYYLLPVIGIDVPAMVAAVVTVGICVQRLYFRNLARRRHRPAERPGRSGDRHRHAAARRLDPHHPAPGVQLSLPALVNELILLVKASSLVSVVGILELTRASQAQAATTFRPLEVYIAAGLHLSDINLCLCGARTHPEHRTAP